ncbi:MAG TPA: histidine--tRNA ligase [Alphaproteobacteria bacterium]|nr:histidine--tRNA ligase [Rhodospirillaceae bacterium]HRJ12616.1 histidine--tRNA ligase [Alphaproteobacteria bacterium]
MSDKVKIIKPQPISGFPEYLPEIRRVEQLWQDTARRVFERYGFCSIETPSVEAVEVLAAKGVVDKEIYVLSRLQADEDEKTEGRLALHFDQTVPLARYVAQHFNGLAFPFKRYQMQRVWRGDRPQDGRFREFYQYDVDVIAVDNLPLHFDAEMAQVSYELLAELKIAGVRLHISNRKILQGFMAGIGVADAAPIVRIMDKLDKIGAKGVQETLQKSGLVNDSQIEKCLTLAEIQAADAGEFQQKISVLKIDNEILSEGISELSFVMDYLKDLPSGAVLADMSIARGLDYYTGTVYEGRLINDPGFGSVIAGGRYDDLASSYINKNLPGVGISLGMTRLFSKLLKDGKLPALAPSPTQVLVALPNEEMRAAAQAIAQQLRARGINTEVYHAPQKFDRQLTYANKKQIPFVWFPDSGQVKNMATGEQVAADAASWQAY